MLRLPPSIEHHYFRVLALREEVARLRASAAYSGAGDALLAVLADALAKIAADFASLTHGSDGEARKAARYGQVASVFHDCLQFVQGGDEAQSPSSLVEPLETLARDYMANCQLLARASFRGGLAAYWCEFFVPSLRTLLGGLPEGGGLAKRLDGFVSLVFPSAERENLLMHAILGHELGHGLSYVLHTTKKLTVAIPDDVKRRLSELRLSPIAFARAVVNWLEELVADAWGLHLMGPAFYFASRRAMSQTPGSTTHPSGRFRLDSLRQQLTWRGYFRSRTDLTDWLRQQVADIESSAVPGLPTVEEPLLQAVEQSLRALGRTVFDAVRQHQPRKAFTPARFRRVDAEPVNRLCYLVPPDQTDGAPAALPDVLNAGWLVRLRKWDRFCDALGTGRDPDRRFEALAKLNSLLLKALEYSAVRTHWAPR